VKFLNAVLQCTIHFIDKLIKVKIEQGNHKYQRLRLRCATPPSPFVADNKTRSMLAIKRLPTSCARRCMDQSNSQFIKVLGLSGTFSPKSPPRNTLFLGPSPLIIPNGISIGTAFFLGPKCYAVQCIVNGKKKPKNCPFPLRFRHLAGGGPSLGHKQHA